MRITEVVITNFGPFGEREKLDLRKGSLFLVKGRREDNKRKSNGSGKTSLFEAIAWAQYGSVSKTIIKSEIIRSGEDTCGVSVCYDDGFKIQRIIEGSTKLKIYENGVLQKFKTTTLAQKYLDDRLGIGYEFWRNSFYASQQQVDRFISATNSEKKAILTKLLGLDFFDDCLKVSRDRCKKLQHEHINLTSSIGTIGSMLYEVDEDKIVRLREKRDDLKSEISDVGAKISKIKGEYIKKKREFRDEKEEIGKVGKKHLLELREIDVTIDALRDRIKKLKKIDGKCPVCDSKVADTYKDKVISSLNSNLSELKKIKSKQKKRYSRACKKDIAITEKYEAKFTEIKKPLKKLYNRGDDIESDLKTVGKELAVFEERKREIAKMKGKVNKCEVRLKKVKRSEDINQYAVKAFGINGIRSMKLSDVIEAIGREINAMLETVDQEIRVKFVLKDGGLSIKNIKGRSWRSMSGGEKQICGIFTYLAMTKMAASWTNLKFAMYDEILDQLDGYYAEMVVDVLRKFVRQTGIQLLMTSHRPDVKFKGFKKIRIIKGECARIL